MQLIMKATDLYEKLSNLYGSPYPDKTIEKKAAIKILEKNLKENTNLVEVVQEKLQQLMQQQNMKCKLSALIEDGFWNKTYKKELVIRRYNPNQI